MAARSMTPWMGTVTITLANTAYQLSTLVFAATNPPLTPATGVLRCEFLSIQADVDAGGARFFIGNSDVSSTNMGYELVATGNPSPMSMTSNLVRLDQIYVMSDTESTKLNITFITR